MGVALTTVASVHASAFSQRIFARQEILVVMLTAELFIDCFAREPGKRRNEETGSGTTLCIKKCFFQAIILLFQFLLFSSVWKIQILLVYIVHRLMKCTSQDTRFMLRNVHNLLKCVEFEIAVDG